jgi:hypothetical protein
MQKGRQKNTPTFLKEVTGRGLIQLDAIFVGTK